VPLNIAVKDTDEYVVDQIVGHNISDPIDTKWRVRWAGYEASDDTFHDYCVDNELQRFIPRKHSKRLREEEDETVSDVNAGDAVYGACDDAIRNLWRRSCWV
jgi:hypothetical protein